MLKIEKLTTAQEAQLVEFREKWLRVGLATGPADISKVSPVIVEFYKRIGKGEPYIWHCQSPFQAQLIANILKQPNLRDNLWDNLVRNLGDNLRDNLVRNLRDNLWDNLRDNLVRNLRDNLGDNLWDNLGDNLAYQYEFCWGSLEAYWITYYIYPHLHLRKMHNESQMQLLGMWETLASNSFWIYAFDGLCIVCDRPQEINKDERARLHCENGPAVSFSDGWAVWYIHGVSVPQDVVENTSSITVDRIEQETNAEVRRVMIDRYGQSRYLNDSGAKEIHRDDWGILYRQEIPNDEPLVMVKVVNSTPEPDGSYKDYFIRVPPNCETALEAVAWTFEKSPDQYRRLKMQT